MKRETRILIVVALLGAQTASGQSVDSLLSRAQQQYWAKDFRAAAATYERAIALDSSNGEVRVRYGRFLVETGDMGRARTVLTPMLGVPSAHGRGEAILGMASYWEGDLGTADRLLRTALNADPTQSEVRNELLGIAALTAPWFRSQVSAAHDDQPLNRLEALLEAGWYPTPGTALAVRGSSSGLGSSGSPRAIVSTAEVGVTTYEPDAAADFDAAVGAMDHAASGLTGRATDWIGHAGVGVRVPAHLTVRARGERTPYLFTTASLDTHIITNAATALVSLNDPHGWLGETAVRREWYPDANHVSSVYAWLLAPVVHRSTGDVQIGYSISAQNADSSRFVPDNGTGSTGHYAPYYTPANLVSQSIIASTWTRLSGTMSLHVNGAYGFAAHDDAPSLLPIGAPRGTPFRLQTVQRGFSPWNARMNLEFKPSRDVTWSLVGEGTHTAFYTMSQVSLQVTYKFAQRAVEHASLP